MTHEEFSSATYDVPPLVFSYLPPSSAKSRIYIVVYSQRLHCIVVILNPFFFQIWSSLPKVAFALPMHTFTSLSQLLSTAIDCPGNKRPPLIPPLCHQSRLPRCVFIFVLLEKHQQTNRYSNT